MGGDWRHLANVNRVGYDFFVSGDAQPNKLWLSLSDFYRTLIDLFKPHRCVVSYSDQTIDGAMK